MNYKSQLTHLFLLISFSSFGQSIKTHNQTRGENAFEYRTISGVLVRLSQGNSTGPFLARNHQYPDTKDSVHLQFDNLLTKYGSLGWEISNILDYRYMLSIPISCGDCAPAISRDSLIYKVIFKRSIRAVKNNCNTQEIKPTCEVVDGILHCKGVTILQNAQGGPEYRSQSIILPKYSKIDEVDFNLCNSTNLSNIFSIYSTKLVPNFSSQKSQVSINAVSVKNIKSATDRIVCSYEVWGTKE
ncbi:MAG: hypothetical protein ACRCSM_06320 [Sediminibacterium sp.]|nr:hypothetical protein [Chitinophagaceae bacterium]MCA6446614.1 hypothetical protein [Chitinophagaceae bacterium]